MIVQNDVGNKYSPTVIAAAITSQEMKASLPTHINLASGCSGLARDSVVLLEQIRTLDKKRLREKRGFADKFAMSKVDHALSISWSFKFSRLYILGKLGANFNDLNRILI